MRFLVAGGSSTILDYVIYWILSMNINYNLAKGISMACSCFYSYLLNKSFTFKDNSRTTARHIVRYLVSQIINISINIGINGVVYRASANKLLGMLCATAIAMIANYMLQKYFVFHGEIK